MREFEHGSFWLAVTNIFEVLNSVASASELSGPKFLIFVKFIGDLPAK